MASNEEEKKFGGEGVPASIDHMQNDDDDVITLMTADGEEVDFVEIAGIAYRGNFYAILQPVELLDGMEDDEALVKTSSKSNLTTLLSMLYLMNITNCSTKLRATAEQTTSPIKIIAISWLRKNNSFATFYCFFAKKRFQKSCQILLQKAFLCGNILLSRTRADGLTVANFLVVLPVDVRGGNKNKEEKRNVCCINEAIA